MSGSVIDLITPSSSSSRSRSKSRSKSRQSLLASNDKSLSRSRSVSRSLKFLSRSEFVTVLEGSRITNVNESYERMRDAYLRLTRFPKFKISFFNADTLGAKEEAYYMLKARFLDKNSASPYLPYPTYEEWLGLSRENGRNTSLTEYFDDKRAYYLARTTRSASRSGSRSRSRSKSSIMRSREISREKRIRSREMSREKRNREEVELARVLNKLQSNMEKIQKEKVNETYGELLKLYKVVKQYKDL